MDMADAVEIVEAHRLRPNGFAGEGGECLRLREQVGPGTASVAEPRGGSRGCRSVGAGSGKVVWSEAQGLERGVRLCCGWGEVVRLAIERGDLVFEFEAAVWKFMLFEWVKRTDATVAQSFSPSCLSLRCANHPVWIHPLSSGVLAGC